MPVWLAERMTQLGTAIAENIVYHYGTAELLSRLSDPFWFQALGCVMGMDWHSSGITTSVVGALKRGLNPRAHELGIYVCGGRGKHSRKTPHELRDIAAKLNTDGDALIRTSRLTAKIDNNAIADGFQLYLHSFFLSAEGQWAVVQQGMNAGSGLARRYHWHSAAVRDFVNEPHTAIVGEHQGEIMNLVDAHAQPAQNAMLQIAREHPDKTLAEVRKLQMSARHGESGHDDVRKLQASADHDVFAHSDIRNLQTSAFDDGRDLQMPRHRDGRKLQMPAHHDVRVEDVDLKRLGGVLALAYQRNLRDFASLLLLENLGPRTLQSMALIAEVVHGAPSRFSDPARFSFAHGGKDGHPFPVPLKTYDAGLGMLRRGLEMAKLGNSDKVEGFRRLDQFERRIEEVLQPRADFDAVMRHERAISSSIGGRTVFDDRKKTKPRIVVEKQLALFKK